MPTGQVWSSSTIMVPVPMRLPTFAIAVKSMGVSRCSSTRKSVEAPPGSSPRNVDSVAHTARMLFKDFADRRPHGQFPESRALHFSAGPEQFGAGVLVCGPSRGTTPRHC